MPKLSIVATPIGNLDDMTVRAVRTLNDANVIYAEDTRVTSVLLGKYNIKTKLKSCHQHSGQNVYNAIITYLQQGKNVAYVTDAGTPGISDPGGKIVASVYTTLEDTVFIEAIPGPSALTAALSISGFPSDKFVFYGFLPHKKGRETMLKEIVSHPYTGVLYESPHRILKTLNSLAKLIESRSIVVTRELTKRFETVYRGTTEEVFKKVSADKQKGEFVIIIYPLTTKETLKIH